MSDPGDSKSRNHVSDIKDTLNLFGKDIMEIVKECEKYNKDGNCVFGIRTIKSENKKEEKEEEWMFVMKRTKKFNIFDSTEPPKIVVKEFAKNIDTEMKVIAIFKMDDPKITKIKPGDFGVEFSLSDPKGIINFISPIRAYYQRTRPKDYTGKWIEWQDDGTKHICSEYSNGNPTGHWIYWCYDRKLCEYEYVRGQGQGQGQPKILYWTQYHDNGVIESEGNRIGGVEGERTGYWIEYYKNGETRAEGEMKDGFKIGTWTYYDENGLVSISTYDEIASVSKDEITSVSKE